MFDDFQRAFSKDSDLSLNEGRAPASLDDLCGRFGGDSFSDGLYRVMRPIDTGAWNDRIAMAFPEFGGRTRSFGFDWLGRVFAVDPDRLENGQPGVIMFEPGTGEALEIPCDIGSFHNEELVDYHDAALASDFFRKWIDSRGERPKYDQCVGYKRLLFLNGKDEISNLEIANVDVYWHLAGQLIRKAKGLPPGTGIRIEIS